MDKVSMQFMTSPELSLRNKFPARKTHEHVPNIKTQETIEKALRGEDVYGPFSTVEELMASLNKPDFDSLNAEFLSLKAKVIKIQALVPIPNKVIECAQVLPKIGDPKLDEEGKLQQTCDFLTEELQNLHDSAKLLLRQVNSVKGSSLELAILSANINVLIGFLKKRFEETQTIAFLIRCHDAAVEEPIKTSSNPLLAEFL